MPGLKLQVTAAGRAALVNAKKTGTNAVLISHVGIAAAPFAASPDLTTLPNEIKRIGAVGGTITAADTIHVSIRDESTAVYDCYGFGLFLSDGTLFAVYSQPTLLLGKAAAAMMLLALDAVFVDIDVQQLSFGDTNFTDPAATTEVPGIVELATEAEAADGVDKVRAITAWLLKKVLDARLGVDAPSVFVRGLLGLASAALIRTALELKGAALKDEGSGKGLDADKLDGQHGAYYQEWGNLTGVPSTASRWPKFAEVTDRPEAYPPESHSHSQYVPVAGGSMTGPLASSGTITGDSGGNGTIPAFKVGNDAGLWDVNVGHAFGIRSLSDGNFGHLYFGVARLVWIGVHPSDPNVSTMGIRQYHQINLPNGSPSYVFCDSQHVAHYKRAGAYGFYWRKNSTGTPGGTGETELMNVSDGGVLWTLSGYAWGSSRKLKDIMGELPYGLAEVERLSAYIGRYKPTYNPDGRVRLFLDAEQLLGVMPETVDPHGVDFNGERVPAVHIDQLLPVAFNAIKQLSCIVRQLQAEVAELRALH